MPESPNARAEMPFLDHLEELRWRILWSLLAIVLATVAGWVIVERVDVIGLLIQPIKPLLPDGKLKFTHPTEPFFITLKFAFVLGLVLSSPVVIYQAWAFLAPALYPREKRLIVPALSAGVVLFLGGATVAYLWVLPRALRVLFGFQQSVFDPIITAEGYFGFAAQIMIGFGVVTELPLVVVILAALGLVTPQLLARNRRYAIALSAVAAALLTPPDAVSMLIMMVPLLLLYEVSIVCAWVVTKRRARRERAASAAGIVLLLLVAAPGRVHAQGPPPRPDTSHVRADSAGQGRTLDSATAHKLGLPTGPTRSFPPSDAVMDSLLRLKGYRVTQYVADTMLVEGDSAISLWGQAFVDRDGTKLESDSIRYRQASCRLDATGDPRLFDQGTVLVGERMRYDTCIRRGTVSQALTHFQQGGATWYMRGDLAVDSGSTRLYGASSQITSDDNPVPDYHFGAHKVKWLNKTVMVGRPAVLYVRDVPIMWLPFIFQDIRPGRRSGILVPRFGLNDIVRPTRSYHRHVAGLGYYFVVNDYVDFLVSSDWYSGRYVALRGQTHYRWLDRFVTGSFSFDWYNQLDVTAHSIRVGWQHQQSFSSRTNFNASIDYSTNTSVIQSNTANPYLATARLGSQLNFTKQFDWGTLNIGGNRYQDIGNGLISQNFPNIGLTPSPVNITSWITWSPGFSLNNQQTFHSDSTSLLVAGPGGVPDTLARFADSRETQLSFQTPLRIGPWNWSNSFQVTDRISDKRTEFVFDSTSPGGARRVLYDQTFETRVEWQTGINLPSLLTGTWKLQPGLSIVNTTTAGPYAIRNQFTGGRWLHQGKRLAFTASVSPTFFGFFPGVGPLQRIRHSISPQLSYFYAPGAAVPQEFARALDPTGRNTQARTDPQQTIGLGLSQNFEAKLKPPPGDTTGREARKIRLLSINTTSIGYNFEQAKDSGRTGWTTQTLGNTFASDLLPGFSLALTHDLWQGTVGSDTAKFSPFLTSITASFSVTPATIRGIGSMFGLGGGKGAAAPAPGPTPGGQPGGQLPGQLPGGPIDQRAFGGPPPQFAAGAGGRGFNLTVSYSGTRIRPRPDSVGALTPAQGGQQQLTLGLSFSPTQHWSASWTSTYDVDTKQFGQHVIQLQRDLHRWHASFSFLKSPNGNFAFSFFVSLLDEPDIKFDYNQQSFAR